MDQQLPLPGLGDPGESRPSELLTQVRRSLQALADAGQVDERHSGLMQLAVELAKAIRPGEKAYGVAQCAAQLLATFEKLMPEPEAGDSDAFSDLRAYLAGVDAGRGTA